MTSRVQKLDPRKHFRPFFAVEGPSSGPSTAFVEGKKDGSKDDVIIPWKTENFKIDNRITHLFL